MASSSATRLSTVNSANKPKTVSKNSTAKSPTLKVVGRSKKETAGVRGSKVKASIEKNKQSPVKQSVAKKPQSELKTPPPLTLKEINKNQPIDVSKEPEIFYPPENVTQPENEVNLNEENLDNKIIVKTDTHQHIDDKNLQNSLIEWYKQESQAQDNRPKRPAVGDGNKLPQSQTVASKQVVDADQKSLVANSFFGGETPPIAQSQSQDPSQPDKEEAVKHFDELWSNSLNPIDEGKSIGKTSDKSASPDAVSKNSGTSSEVPLSNTPTVTQSKKASSKGAKEPPDPQNPPSVPTRSKEVEPPVSKLFLTPFVPPVTPAQAQLTQNPTDQSSIDKNLAIDITNLLKPEEKNPGGVLLTQIEKPTVLFTSPDANVNEKNSMSPMKKTLYILLFSTILGMGTLGLLLYLLWGQIMPKFQSLNPDLNQPPLASQPDASLNSVSSPAAKPVASSSAKLDRSKIALRILNGSQKPGAAATLSATLKKFGYNLAFSGNATSSAFLNTKIRTKPETATISAQLMKDMGEGYKATTSADLPKDTKADAEIIIGKD